MWMTLHSEDNSPLLLLLSAMKELTKIWLFIKREHRLLKGIKKKSKKGETNKKAECWLHITHKVCQWGMTFVIIPEGMVYCLYKWMSTLKTENVCTLTTMTHSWMARISLNELGMMMSASPCDRMECWIAKSWNCRNFISWEKAYTFEVSPQVQIPRNKYISFLIQ